MQKRCPWCGKIVNTRGSGVFKHSFAKKKTPLVFVFLPCQHCGNFYGQNVKSKRVIICVMLMLISVFFTTIFKFSILMISLLFFVMINEPLNKMTNEEEIIKESYDKICAEVTDCWSIKKHHIYLIEEDFDDFPSFEKSSPIRIDKINKLKKQVWFHFLYDSDINNKIINDRLTIYDDNSNSHKLILK